MWTVYLIRCSDDSIYTGCTSDFDQRLEMHNKGQVKYTSSRLPFELVTYIVFNDKHRAYKFEKYLKPGSGKAFSNKRFI